MIRSLAIHLFLCLAFCLFGCFSSPLQAQRVQSRVHTVSSGETLFKIARRYGIELRELRDLNPRVKGDLIFPGQELVISLSAFDEDVDFIANTGLPRNSSSSEWQDGHIDQLRKNDNREEYVFNKKANDPTASKLIMEAFQDRRIIHTVQAGEDIYAISRMYAVKPEKILESNPGKKVRMGTSLIIPLTKGSDALVLSEEIRVRKIEPRHAELIDDPKLVSDRGPYEIVRRDEQDNPFYVLHPSFQKGQKVFIQIPQNAGFVEARVIGRLPSTSRSIIGISPRIYEIIEASEKSGLLTIYFEPQ